MARMTSGPGDQFFAAPADPPARRSWGVVVALGTLLILAGAYLLAVIAISGQDVAAGTSVRGVDIGGMSTEQAVTVLEAELGEEASALIPVRAGEITTVVDPAESGLAVDWEATVDQASGLILNPVALWEHVRGEVAIEPITTTDTEQLAASMEEVSLVAAVDPVEPEISFSDESVAVLTPGADGTSLDVAGSVDAVSAAYIQVPVQTVVLPTEAIPTAVSAEEAQRVLRELAEPAVALPVRLRVIEPAAKEGEQAPSTRVTIQPVDIARTLTFAVEGATLAPTLNGKKLHKRLADELDEIERAGRDARIVIRSNKPTIVPSRTGLAVDPDQLSAAVLPVLPAATSDARLAEVTLAVSPADFTTADAKALNITEKLSSFRQPFVPANYRYVNVGEAARRINGTILEPGETFSMNETVGERTPANGFTEGFIISGGVFREELGGGVSIITTAMWTAGFYAGLERVEQHPHGLYISRYQAGLEATVAWGLLDLRMRNRTGNGVLITATRYSDGVVIEMWGTKKFDKVTATFSERRNYTDYRTIYDDSDRCVPSQGVRGFSISVTRRRYVDGEVFSKETWPTTYKPTPNVVCGPDPSG
jgi:vancomycin resistance protein YoaR